MWFQDVQSSFPSYVRGLKVTSCLVLAEAAKRRESTHRHTPLGVGEFEVATGGGIWVAIGAYASLHPSEAFLFGLYTCAIPLPIRVLYRVASC